MRVRPTAITLDCHQVSGNLREFAGELFRRIEGSGLGALKGWMDEQGEGTQADLENALSRLPNDPEGSAGKRAMMSFELAGSVLGSVMLDPKEDGPTFCAGHLQKLVSEADSQAELIDFQNRCVALCQDLLADIGLYSADLSAHGAGGECLPRVPMVDARTRITVTNREQVERNYDDPEAFWAAGWTKVAEHRGQHLLVRGGEARFGPDFLSAIIDDHWAMGRAAKSQRTRYSKPYIITEEKEIFCSGEKRLHFIGYAEDEKLMEYSCALNPGEHIHGWEIYGLFDIVTEKKTRDGSPVKTVRIVFLDEWAARQEKRPLLDIGCRVYHYDDEGELRELKD